MRPEALMKRAIDIMDPSPCTVTPDVSVRDLAQRLLQRRDEGACVVQDGRLVGVVTTMDLIFQEQPVHLPSFLTFFDAVIPLERPSHTQHEVEKLLGLSVKDIMTTDLITLGAETRLDEIAARMVKKHTGYIPIVDGDRLLGVVTKPAVLRAAFGIDETGGTAA
jgi:CBS domain-containing protein